MSVFNESDVSETTNMTSSAFVKSPALSSSSSTSSYQSGYVIRHWNWMQDYYRHYNYRCYYTHYHENRRKMLMCLPVMEYDNLDDVFDHGKHYGTESFRQGSKMTTSDHNVGSVGTPTYRVLANSSIISTDQIVMIVILACIILAFVILLVAVRVRFSALVKAQLEHRRILRSRAMNASRNQNQYIVPETGNNNRSSVFGNAQRPMSMTNSREETHAIIIVDPNRAVRPNIRNSTVHSNNLEQNGNWIPPFAKSNLPDEKTNLYIQLEK